MNIRITSIVNSEVGKLIRAVTTDMEDKLQPLFDSRHYGGGFKQFAVFFVSVDTDPIENERYCVANNHTGKYKDTVSGEMVKYVGIAVPVDPKVVLDSTGEALARLMRDSLLDELTAPAYAMPKTFDRAKLLADLKAALV
ncbi:hypothetical protein [Caldimonas sp. KR1-144]|uniref:hypothetical protein n=1 Tax=Caldimonas sp. KR1-144 TaxID=3400911 RepID=UPI003C0E07CA